MIQSKFPTNSLLNSEASRLIIKVTVFFFFFFYLHPGNQCMTETYPENVIIF